MLKYIIKKLLLIFVPYGIDHPQLLIRVQTEHLHTKQTSLRRLTAAAIVILLAGAIAYIGRQYTLTIKKQDARSVIHSVFLTLADQQQVVLDSLPDGTVTTQGQTTISIKNGQLAYTAREIKGVCGVEFGPLFNTLTTPKGRQYRFTLPDGTQVWLNGASTITYPTEFCGKERIVSITGEAYFEVAKDPSRPFNIRTNNMEAEVLGTSVDIDAYSGQGTIRTTLLEGRIKVKNAASSVVLRSGQQASLDASNATARFKVKEHVNLEEVMAWKGTN